MGSGGLSESSEYIATADSLRARAALCDNDVEILSFEEVIGGLPPDTKASHPAALKDGENIPNPEGSCLSLKVASGIYNTGSITDEGIRNYYEMNPAMSMDKTASAAPAQQGGSLTSKFSSIASLIKPEEPVIATPQDTVTADIQVAEYKLPTPGGSL